MALPYYSSKPNVSGTFLTIFLVLAVFYASVFSIEPKDNETLSAINNETEQGVAGFFNEVTSLSDNLNAAPETSKVSLDHKRVVEPGDTMLSILLDVGLDNYESAAVIASMRKVFDPRRLQIGDAIDISLDKASAGLVLASLTFEPNPAQKVVVTRTAANTYNSQLMEKELVLKTQLYQGYINNSLAASARHNGVPEKAIAQMINAYSYIVDFQRDIQRGDSFTVFVEQYFDEKDEAVRSGDLLYARLNLSGETKEIFLHRGKNGDEAYYDANGNSIRRGLLRTPIEGARLTSGYGMRMHPVLGYSRMHRGVDFGAATGTPIKAAGDGVVEIASWRSGYGNFIRIRHNNEYSTAYGHMSRYAKGIKPGTRVRQGQVIAYVGSTGVSTGPHLHYEVIRNGAQINPSKAKFIAGDNLTGRELANFKQNAKTLLARVNAMSNSTQLAAAQ